MRHKLPTVLLLLGRASAAPTGALQPDYVLPSLPDAERPSPLARASGSRTGTGAAATGAFEETDRNNGGESSLGTCPGCPISIKNSYMYTISYFNFEFAGAKIPKYTDYY